MVRTARKLVIVAMSAMFVGACGAASIGSPSSSTPAGSTGQIHGLVNRGPGADPRSGGAAATPVPVSGDPVVVKDAQGIEVSHAVSLQDGTFVIEIGPGAYTVVESICAVKKQVDVRSQAVTEVTLTIPNGC